MAVVDLLDVSKDGRCHSCRDTFSLISIIKSNIAGFPNRNVQIVKFFSVGIWTSHADRYLLSIYVSWFLFDDLRDDLGVLLRQPAEKRWNTHICFCAGEFQCQIRISNSESSQRRKESLYDITARTMMTERW